jgi:hypothetical protein
MGIRIGALSISESSCYLPKLTDEHKPLLPPNLALHHFNISP